MASCAALVVVGVVGMAVVVVEGGGASICFMGDGGDTGVTTPSLRRIIFLVIPLEGEDGRTSLARVVQNERVIETGVVDVV